MQDCRPSPRDSPGRYDLLMPVLRGRAVDDLIEPYRHAFEQAEIGSRELGIPDGAALVRDGSPIARGRNRRVQAGDPEAHGVIDCLQGVDPNDDHGDTVLYATRPPCATCAGAILEQAIPVVVIGDDSLSSGEMELLNARGVKTLILEDSKTRRLVAEFHQRHPEVWAEDIGGD